MAKVPGAAALRGVASTPLEKRSLVGTFATDVEAELARVKLEAEGIGSIVVEPARMNPLQLQAAAGARVEVPESQATRARAILAALAVTPDELSDEERVRCPRCELEYCDFQRPTVPWIARKLSGVAGLLILTIGIPVVAVLSVFKLLPKRWTCEKCGHRWDDPNEGPKLPTMPEPDDPRPVFRLRRGSPGMGLFLGGIGAGLAELFVDGGWLLGMLPVAGIVAGSMVTRDVCSEPKCRNPLPPSGDECPRCKGVIGGIIERDWDHYAEAAAARRAIAADREKAA